MVGLLYELFYAPGFAMQLETMNMLMRWAIVRSIKVRAFCGVVRDPESEEEMHVEGGNEMLMPKIEAVLTAGKQSQKTEEKLYPRLSVLIRRLLLLERVCKMNASYCWDYFRGNSPSAQRLLEWVEASCLAGVGGVQESSYQVLATLLLPETPGDVSAGVAVECRWRTWPSSGFSTATACTD